MLWCALAVVFIVSYLLTRQIRLFALKSGLMDIPNERSSHSIPTPRGGGVAFTAAFLGGILALLMMRYQASDTGMVLLVGGFFIALLGYLDDRSNLSAKYRLFMHVFICGVSVVCLGTLPAIQWGGVSLSNAWLLGGLTTFYLAWLLNLFNFMDGIDGLAGAEALTVCLGMALIEYQANYPFLLLPTLILAAAMAGFLIWNFPPAKIFMGDVGSGFLGFTLGILSLIAAQTESTLFICWLIMMAVFITDATYTLLRRAIQGEAILSGHCSHGYQELAKKYASHTRVTVGVCLINLLWLLPIAVQVSRHQLAPWIGLVMAYMPLGLFSIGIRYIRVIDSTPDVQNP